LFSATSFIFTVSVTSLKQCFPSVSIFSRSMFVPADSLQQLIVIFGLQYFSDGLQILLRKT